MEPSYEYGTIFALILRPLEYARDFCAAKMCLLSRVLACFGIKVSCVKFRVLI